MEKWFSFNMPIEVIFGNGSIRDLNKVATTLGKKALVVTDKLLVEVRPFRETMACLKEGDIQTIILGNVIPNPRDVNVHEGVDLFKKNNCDLLIAVGGGSSIDCAKAIGAIVTNGGKVQDLLQDNSIRNPIPPLIAIPTTAGTGSEVSSDALITDSRTHEKLILSSRNLLPKIALLDPNLTVSLPPDQTAFTGLDALTHAIEAYTAKGSNPVSDGITRHAIKLIGRYIEAAYNNGEDIEARRGMLLGSLMAGIAFSNAGPGTVSLNAGLGSVHTMGEVLAGACDIPHGAAMAIFLPYILEYSLESAVHKYAEVSGLLGLDISGLSEEDAAKKGFDHIKGMVRALRIPSLASFGVKPDVFDKLAGLCKDHLFDTMNPRNIEEKTYRELYQMAYDNRYHL